MSSNPIFDKWRKSSLQDESFKQSLYNLGLKNDEKEIEQVFNEKIQFVDNKIIAKIGAGTNLINDYTITAIGMALADMISKNNTEASVFLATDNYYHSILYSNIFARVLTEKHIQSVVYDTPGKLPFALRNLGAQNEKCNVFVSFQYYKGNKNVMQVAFNWDNGKPFSALDIMNLTWKINSTNFLKVDIPEEGVNFKFSHTYCDYNEKIIEEYSKYDYWKDKNLKFGIDISNLRTKEFYENILSKIGVEYGVPTRTKNPGFLLASNQSYFKKIYFEGLFKNYIANFIISEDGSGVNISVKHGRVYKYFKPDEIAALYLNFLLEDDETFDHSILKKAYVAYTLSAGTLTAEIAHKNNIAVEKVIRRSQVWEVVDNHPDQKLLLAYTANNEFATYKNLFFGFDANSFMLELMRMVAFYKRKNKTLFDKLNELYDIYSKHHISSKQFTLDVDAASHFIKRIMSAEKIGNHKIVNRREYTDNGSTQSSFYYCLYFEGGDSITVTYSYIDKLVRIEEESITKGNLKTDKDKKVLDMIIRDREYLDGLSELIEDMRVKKLSPWSIIKYFLFAGIFIGIIVILVHSVLNVKSGGSFTGKQTNAWELLKIINAAIFTSYNSRFAFLFLALEWLISIFLNCLIFKRLLWCNGEKVKLKHLIIGSAIGIFVQNITPKSIGGDIATYWYLRRKGVTRSNLVAAVVMNTFLWQLVNIVLAIIFVPIGIKVYNSTVFASGWDDPNNKVFLIFLILGLTLDTFSAAMFFSLAISKKIQKFTLKVFIGFLEWLPFFHLYDPETMKAKYDYEFYEIRKGIKTSFKKVWPFFEVYFYKLIGWAITPIAVFSHSLNVIEPSHVNWYWDVTLSGILVRSANSFSPTPGGTGTSEYFTKSIYNSLFIEKTTIGSTEYDNTQIASLVTAIKSYGTVLIPSIVSGLLLMTVYIGEKRLDRYKAKEKNLKLLYNTSEIPIKTKLHSVFYPIMVVVWIVAVVAGLTVFLAIQPH